jgi:hypothetical protein
MKIQILIAGLIILFGQQSFAQNLQESKYNDEFKTCPTEYADLERLINAGLNESDLYLLNGEPFSGCAKSDSPENERYFLFHIRAGVVQQQIGYYYNGNISREFNFSNGQAHGRHVMYNSEGALYIEEYYENGQPVHLKRWHANGELAREAKFENGEKVLEVFYDKDGNEINN